MAGINGLIIKKEAIKKTRKMLIVAIFGIERESGIIGKGRILL